jgi:hypothetical protein
VEPGEREIVVRSTSTGAALGKALVPASAVLACDGGKILVGAGREVWSLSVPDLQRTWTAPAGQVRIVGLVPQQRGILVFSERGPPVRLTRDR